MKYLFVAVSWKHSALYVALILNRRSMLYWNVGSQSFNSNLTITQYYYKIRIFSSGGSPEKRHYNSIGSSHLETSYIPVNQGSLQSLTWKLSSQKVYLSWTKSIAGYRTVTAPPLSGRNSRNNLNKTHQQQGSGAMTDTQCCKLKTWAKGLPGGKWYYRLWN